MSLVHGQLLGHPERLPGGKDGHLRHRIRVFREDSNQRMAGLVHRDGLLLLRQQRVRSISPPQQDPVPGRCVAAITTTPAEGSKPSISASSWFRVCSRSSLETMAPPLRAPIASISSMNTMAGARFRASTNRSRTRDAPTPTKISMKDEPVTEKNGTPASPATARAMRVLPVPGGPTINTPLGPIAPTFE